MIRVMTMIVFGPETNRETPTRNVVLLCRDWDTRESLHNLAEAGSVALTSASRPELLPRAVKETAGRVDAFLAIAETDDDIEEALDAFQDTGIEAPVVIGSLPDAVGTDPEIMAVYDEVVTPPGYSSGHDALFMLRATHSAIEARQQ